MRGREIRDDRPTSVGSVLSGEPQVVRESIGYESEMTDEVMDESMDGSVGQRPIDVDSDRVSREVNIRPLDSGYLVKVGCQSVAVETTESLIKALNDYLTNPAAFERAWFKNQNRNKLQ
jgi:hypothetical protein